MGIIEWDNSVTAVGHIFDPAGHRKYAWPSQALRTCGLCSIDMYCRYFRAKTILVFVGIKVAHVYPIFMATKLAFFSFSE